MTTETVHHDAAVQRDEWYILRPFMHEGITYGRNEQLPETMSTDEVLGLARIGVLAKIRPDGSIERAVLPKPDSPAAYLRQSDSQVLRSIREHPPSQEDMQQIAALAVQARRGTLLVDALNAMAGAPLVPPPRGGVAYQGVEAARLQAELREAVDSLERERQQHGILRSEHEFLQDEHRKLQEQVAAHNASA